MVELSVVDDQLILNVKGWDKLWSFRSTIEVPLRKVRDVRAIASQEELKEIFKPLGVGFRFPGTALPGVITAGTFYFTRGGKAFIDVHHPADDVILIELEDEKFNRIIVDVENAAEVAATVRDALTAIHN